MAHLFFQKGGIQKQKFYLLNNIIKVIEYKLKYR